MAFDNQKKKLIKLYCLPSCALASLCILVINGTHRGQFGPVLQLIHTMLLSRWCSPATDCYHFILSPGHARIDGLWWFRLASPTLVGAYHIRSALSVSLGRCARIQHSMGALRIPVGQLINNKPTRPLIDTRTARYRVDVRWRCAVPDRKKNQNS